MTGRKPLPVQALYTATSLARLSGISRERMLRLLEVYGVTVLEVDGVLFVPLIEIERRLEPLWESVVLGAALANRSADAHLRSPRW